MYICIHMYISLSLYISIYMCICIYIYIYMDSAHLSADPDRVGASFAASGKEMPPRCSDCYMEITVLL